MGIFSIFSRQNINEGVKQFKASERALLIDVRSPEEYRQGHIPGSKNIPLENITRIDRFAPDKSTPLFVYCRSGARSGVAVKELEALGYADATNIGGINSYTGELA